MIFFVVADGDAEAYALLHDYPGIRAGLNRFLDTIDDLGALREATFGAVRERLFADDHDCPAARTAYTLTVAVHQNAHAATDLTRSVAYCAARAALLSSWDARLDRHADPFAIVIATAD